MWQYSMFVRQSKKTESGKAKTPARSTQNDDGILLGPEELIRLALFKALNTD